MQELSPHSSWHEWELGPELAQSSRASHSKHVIKPDGCSEPTSSFL